MRATGRRWAGGSAVVATLGLALSCASLIGVSDQVSYGDGGAKDGLSGKDAGGTQEAGATDRTPFRDAADVGQPDAAACYACVPTPPPGWSGPVALFLGSGSPPPTPPGCSGSYASLGGLAFADPKASSACTCDCSVATSPACDSSVTATFSGSCSGAVCADASAPPGTCIDTSACGGGSLWVKASPISPTGGACGKSGETLAPASFTEIVETCTLTSLPPSTCGTGETCAPRPPAAFDEAICILRAGDIACPPGYAKQHLSFTSINDERTCSCSCGAVSGASCAGSVALYTSPACSATAGTVALNPDGGCVFAGTNAPVELHYAVAGASCAPVAGTATGRLVGSTPTTVCCTR